jgi:hypothetical protein
MTTAKAANDITNITAAMTLTDHVGCMTKASSCAGTEAGALSGILEEAFS